MEAIKKKMQAMKAEKDSAVERAETAESMARDANVKAEKVSVFKPRRVWILFKYSNSLAKWILDAR